MTVGVAGVVWRSVLLCVGVVVLLVYRVVVAAGCDDVCCCLCLRCCELLLFPLLFHLVLPLSLLFCFVVFNAV